jgi:hypothetical protein
MTPLTLFFLLAGIDDQTEVWVLALRTDQPTALKREALPDSGLACVASLHPITCLTSEAQRRCVVDLACPRWDSNPHNLRTQRSGYTDSRTGTWGSARACPL